MRKRLRNTTLVPACVAWIVATCAPALGATNVATGVIGDGSGITLQGGDGTGTAAISLQSTRLALNKQARTSDGSVLADGADVSPGQEIWFVLWVDNTTDYGADALTIVDQLNESEFRYTANSIETTTVASGTDDAGLWAATWAPLSDAAGATEDEASFVDTASPAGADRLTVGSVSGQVNRDLSVAPQTMFAIRFSVTVN